MTLSDIYTLLINKINEITGNTYLLDRAPQVNFSEGFSGVYRFIRPSAIRKERTIKRTPQTIISVDVGLLAFTNDPQTVIDAENELDNLLNSLLKIAQLQDNIIVYAAETTPTNQTIVNGDGLDSEQPVVEAMATISIRAFY